MGTDRAKHHHMRMRGAQRISDAMTAFARRSLSDKLFPTAAMSLAWIPG